MVQVAPNELSFSTVAAVKPIYGAGTTCIKAPAYETFGRQGVFQMKDPEEHRQRLRGIAHIFTMGSMLQIEPTIQRTAANLAKAVARGVGKETDALLLMRLTALENGGTVLLGKEFGCFSDEGVVTTPDYVHYLDNTYIVFAVKSLSPLLFSFLKLLPIKGLQDFLRAPDVMYKYGFDAMAEYIATYGRESDHRSLLTKLLQGDRASGTPPLPESDIGVETSNLLFAATDTTSNTLAYTLYRLAMRRDWQDKLREEIRASGVAEAGYSFKSLQGLPVLNAVMQETLRVHPAAPSGLPRLTTGKGIDVDGLHVPANVRLPAPFVERDVANQERLDHRLYAGPHHADPPGLLLAERRRLGAFPVAERERRPDQQRHARDARAHARLGQGLSRLPRPAHGRHGDQGDARQAVFALHVHDCQREDARRHDHDGPLYAYTQGTEVRASV